MLNTRSLTRNSAKVASVQRKARLASFEKSAQRSQASIKLNQILFLSVTGAGLVSLAAFFMF